MREGPETILVRGVNWLGDAVMTTPALQRLRQARPQAHIALLTPEKLSGLWENQPFLDEVLTFAPSENIWQVSRKLRGKNFSTAIAFPNSARSALELWLAGIPSRIGFRQGWRGIFLSQAIPRRAEEVPMRKRTDEEVRRLVAQGAPPTIFPASAHHIHDYLKLTAKLGASAEPLPPQISVSERQSKLILERWPLLAKDDRPWFGLNPGAEYGPAKRWPAERFAAVAVALQKQRGCRWMIFGGAADREIAQKIAGQITEPGSVLNLAGQTTLPELAAALKFCRLLLTNDSGPMHLAAAVGTPVIAIFGSTSPELTGPAFSPKAQIIRRPVPCSPCFRRQCPIDLRCLTGVDIAEVISAADSILDNRR